MSGGTQAAKRRRTGSSPTVSDVARLADVSLMTVSRVVNHATNVSDDTRERVLTAIATLGYVPNPVARSLANGGQRRIALLYANPSSAYLSEFLMGMLGAGSSQATLIIEKHEADEGASDVVARLRLDRADAVVLPPPLCDDGNLIDALVDAGLAIVQVATGQPHAAAAAVMIDDLAAARTMTGHLLALGHRRIGFVEGAADQSASLCRRQGFEQAMQAAGCAIAPEWLVAGDFTYRSGLVAADQLLDAGVTAIFASNDDMAAASVAAAHRRGLDVPGDISIAGFDDSAMATTIWPMLTTIRQPIAEMAGRAVTLLAGNRNGDSEGQAVECLPFALIVRESTGPLATPDRDQP